MANSNLFSAIVYQLLAISCSYFLSPDNGKIFGGTSGKFLFSIRISLVFWVKLKSWPMFAIKSLHDFEIVAKGEVGVA